MPRKPKPEPDDSAQSQRFVEAARALEADETGQRFERALKGVKSPADDRRTGDTTGDAGDDKVAGR